MAMKIYVLVLVAALNPLVTRTPEPQGNVPADCIAGDETPLPRVVVARNPDAPAPAAEPVEAEAEPPPRVVSNPGYDLRALQNAIARNDRAAFDAALARARAGGAQTRVYDDVASLWDAQFESPFFAEGSAAHRTASQYPGYEAAVRSQVYTDASGRKYYPAAESRAFVAKQAGVSVPSTGRVAKSTTNVPISPKPKPTSTRQPGNRATRQPTPKKTVPRTEPAPPSPSPDPSAARVAAATEPAPVVPQAPSAAGSLPPAADPGTVATETAATETTATDTVATDTTFTDTAATGTTATEAATETEVPATTTAATPKSTRRILLPAILILIGLGVLILLFRAR